MANAFSLGFQSLERTVENQQLPVKGSIPHWLKGHLLRNGPALFQVQQRRYNHWFDGLAMLHRFAFDQGEVSYTNRFLESRNFKGVTAKRRMLYDQFSTNPKRGFFEKLVATFDYGLQFGNNNLVSFGHFGDDLVALGETPDALVIDPKDVSTKGTFQFQGSMMSMITTAHPTYDDFRQCIFSYSTRALPMLSRYNVWRMPYGSRRRKTICMVKPRIGQPSYMHSIAASANYLILAEFPLVMGPSRMLFNVWTDSPFITTFSWKPDLGTRFIVIHKDTGKVTATFEGEPFFAYHHVNAWEEDGEIVLDVAAYRDPSVIQNCYLESLLGDHGGDLCYSGLRRYRIPTEGYGFLRTPTELSNPAFEMPWINPHLGGKPYRYAYGFGFEAQGNFNDALIKIDVQKDDAASNYLAWTEPGCYPGEGVFVPRPGATEEDDGVLLSVVLDSAEEKSFLLVLDASNFEEIARAPTPFAIPFGLHGAYEQEFAGIPPTGEAP